MNDLNELWFYADMKCRVLKIACYIRDDKNYKAEDIINDLVTILEVLEDNTPKIV